MDTIYAEYFIEGLQYVEEGSNIYYTGNLCVIDQNGKKEF